MQERGERISAAVVRLLGILRAQAGLTMEGLADRAGVHRTYIGLLEQGKRQPTVDAAVRIAAALGVRLADLLQQAEEQADEIAHGRDVAPVSPAVEVVRSPARRLVSRDHFLDAGSAALKQLTGLDAEMLTRALESAYHTLDLVDAQLLDKDTPPIARLVGLANLSAMLGNLLGAGIAGASGGLYARNRPHAFPDLLPQREGLPGVELKTALERNTPKGHLAKAGMYLTFRYVLTDRDGTFTRGRAGRGTVATIWEVRCGALTESDFALSNTAGDSGKTAVIKSAAFGAMALVYYVPGLNPAARPVGAISPPRSAPD